MERAIIHLNVADFAAAVERRLDHRLCRRPLIIAPPGAVRATVWDMSEEAYQAGVRKGMPLVQARRQCRDARVLAPHPDRYERAMGVLLRQTRPFSPLVEVGQADGHLFLDATGTRRLMGLPMDIAWRLRRQIRQELGLDPIWSVAPNKLVAKVATRLVKPVGEYIVADGEEERFLSPVSLQLIPGIEGHDLARLGELNLTRAAQVLPLSVAQLAVVFGGRATFLYEAVRGRDTSPVVPADARPPRVAVAHAFEEGTNDHQRLDAVLYGLVEQMGRQLRRQGRAAQRLALFVDYADGVRRVRQMALRPASANDVTLFEVAGKVLRLAWTRRVRVRYLQLVGDRLVFPPAQLALFKPERTADTKRRGLVTALDLIRQRFGDGAVAVGRTLAA